MIRRMGVDEPSVDQNEPGSIGATGADASLTGLGGWAEAPPRPKVTFGIGQRLPPLHTFGDEPDPRFTLANERTFLAWNRTALALVGGGLGVTQLLPDFSVPGGNLWLGVPLTVLGGMLALVSYFRWYAIERAMREHQPLPIARVPPLLGLAIGVIAVLSAVLIVISHDTA